MKVRNSSSSLGRPAISTMVPMPGSATSSDVPPIELEDGQSAPRVVEVDGRQPVPDQAYVLERIDSLGDDLARMVGVVRIDGDDAAERGIAVGAQVERPADRLDVLVIARPPRRAAAARSQPRRRLPGRRRRSGSPDRCRARSSPPASARRRRAPARSSIPARAAWRRPGGRAPNPCRDGGSGAPCPGSVRRRRRPPAVPDSGRRRSRRRRWSTRPTRTCSTRSDRAGPHRWRHCEPASGASRSRRG